MIQCVTTGVIENKRLARQALCSAAAIVGGAVAAYAEQQGKHDLFDSVDFSAPDLLHQTEADCLTHCADIFNAGTANLATLTAAITLFTARMNDPRGQSVNRSTLLKEPIHVGCYDEIDERPACQGGSLSGRCKRRAGVWP